MAAEDELSEFLDLLEEDCAADDTVQPPATGLREITEPEDFLRPRDEAGPSTVHAGDTDSSDDEDNRNFEEQNLTSYGRNVKQLIGAREEQRGFSLGGLKGFTQRTVQSDPKVDFSRSQAVPLKKAERVAGLTGKLLDPGDRDCFLEPVSGIRVVNPLVTQSFIQERTAGRQTVACSFVKRKYESNALQEDWLTTGVVVGAMKKVSQKSKEYLSWTISDLKHDMAAVTVFLFAAANSAFTKVAKGTVVGILNPTVLPPSSSKFDLILSVNDAQRVLIIGNSKDYGVCKSKTLKNEPCTNFVNVNICPYCTYHLGKEHKRVSGKPTGPNSNLRAKVLGKSEVFYGGQSYTAKSIAPRKISREHLAQLALPQASNKKLMARDHQLMQSLTPVGSAPYTPPAVISVDPKSFMAKNKSRGHLILNKMQKMVPVTPTADKKKSEGPVSKLSGVLGKGTSSKSPAPAPRTPVGPSPVLPKSKVDLSALGRPTLGKFGSIELGTGGKDKAKNAALQLVRAKGPLKKANPNQVKKAASFSKVEASLKRKRVANSRADDDEEKLRAEFELKKAKFLKMIETGSQHQDLVENAQQEAEDAYFKNMEVKEKIEDKMLNTHKVEAKAVKCSQCNYVSLSRSDFCRKQGHQVKIVQTHKRFFQCKGCKNHIWVLELVPTSGCKNCGQNNWERAGMIRDKQAKLETLRITAGDRDSFTPANINSLVPD